MENVELERKIEAVLFYKATPIKKSALCKLFACSAEELDTGTKMLEERLRAGATRIISTDTEIELVTAPEHDELIESLRKDEMKRDIGKAGAETLAIIMYRGPLTRADIDRVRGVNSAFILRNLMVRGLVEKDTSTQQVMYKATPTLMAHLGITQMTELPDFTNIMNALDTYEQEIANELT